MRHVLFVHWCSMRRSIRCIMFRCLAGCSIDTLTECNMGSSGLSTSLLGICCSFHTSFILIQESRHYWIQRSGSACAITRRFPSSSTGPSMRPSGHPREFPILPAWGHMEDMMNHRTQAGFSERVHVHRYLPWPIHRTISRCSSQLDQDSF